MADDQQPAETIRPVCLDKSDIEDLSVRLFGLTVISFKEFNSYDDRNYYIRVEKTSSNANISNPSENGYVLKIFNKRDSKQPDYIEAMNSLLLHLQDGGISVPVPLPSKTGKYYHLETLVHGNITETCAVRLFSFIPGDILPTVPYEDHLIYSIGKLIGRMDAVLQTFNHPFYKTHEHPWSLMFVPDLRQHLHHVKNDDDRNMVSKVIDEFENNVLTKTDQLQKGMIHGDTNEQNILVDNINGANQVVAILDIGDATLSYLLFEVAISIAYVMIDSKDRLNVGGHFLAGYTSQLKLTDVERDLLKECVAARLVQSLIMGLAASASMPDNTYVLTTSAKGWPCLRELISCPKHELYKKWNQTILQHENNPPS